MASLHVRPIPGASATRPWVVPAELHLVMTGSLPRAGIPDLCEHARRLLSASDAPVVVVDLGAIADVDAAAVEGLAKLQLIARRQGKRIRFRHAGREIRELAGWMGLAGVLRLDPRSSQPRREVEQREQGRGVEEERDP